MGKVKVRTPSRLHITLLDLNGELGRVDGGVGMALEEPNVILEAESIESGLIVEGDRSGRVLEVAKKIIDAYNLKNGIRIRLLRRYEEHVGLGFGTQLSLGVGFALTDLNGIHVSPRDLAKIVRRGGTSGIGVAAFEAGGFIVDGGHTFGLGRQKQSFLPSSASKAPPPPLISRLDFPEDWLVVLATPKASQRVHGSFEVDLFSKYCPIPIEEVRSLSHLILMKLLPSVVEKDIAEFGEAISSIQKLGFKRREVSLQSDEVTNLMKVMVDAGAYGVGLSSFGPTLYTVVDSEKKAEMIAKVAEDEIDKIGGNVLVTKVRNKGAELLYSTEAR
ncbi:MAG: hypothetical protein H3Z50_05080 [archaeon]|nr:hypothetical protein [archaeon]MCP8306848.1 hypothetical protein [archaeon]